MSTYRRSSGRSGLSRFLALLIVGVPILLVLGGLAWLCSLGFRGGTPAEPAYVNLPLPTGISHFTLVAVQTVGDVEDVTLASPEINVQFNNTGEGSGSNELEVVCVKGRCSTATLEYTWGDFWTGSKLTSAEHYDSDGNTMETWLTLKFTGKSIFTFFSCGSCVISESRLVLKYLPDETGWPYLDQAFYVEEYGFDSTKGKIALGPQARWDNAAEIFPQYAEWGFWEGAASPSKLVKTALDNVAQKLKTLEPDYKILDQDGPNEVIGRQTQLTMYKSGDYWGSISFTYGDGWGRMPNTPFIGSGALQRIEWNFADGTYYALSVLSSALDPRPTSLYIFCNTKEAVERVESTQNLTQLYKDIRTGAIPGAFLTVYSGGFVGDITRSGSNSEGTVTINVGSGGGIGYGVLGNPTLYDAKLANNLLALMGRGGITATKFFYANQPGEGNGMLYYTAALSLMLAPEDLVLDTYGLDGGLLDRVGLPDAWMFDQTQLPWYLGGEIPIDIPMPDPGLNEPTPVPTTAP